MRASDLNLNEAVDPVKTEAKIGDALRAKFVKDHSIDSDQDATAFIAHISDNVDPTKNQQYTLWILRMYIKDGVRLYEDMARVREALTTFHTYKRQMPIKDLGQIKALNALEDMVGNIEIKQSGKQEKKEISANIKKETEVFFKGPEGMILIPETEEASCFWGKNTRWCTAATGSHNFFSHYTKDGPLYIIMPKDGTKWQLHVETNQFLDSNDAAFDLAQWGIDYPWALEALKEVYPPLVVVQHISFVKSLAKQQWNKKTASELLASIDFIQEHQTRTHFLSKDDVAELPKEWKYHVYDNRPALAPLGYGILRHGRNEQTEGELFQQVDALIGEYPNIEDNRVGIRDDINETLDADLTELIYERIPAIAPLGWLIKSPYFGRNSKIVLDRMHDLVTNHLMYTDITDDGKIIIGEYEDYEELGLELDLSTVKYIGSALAGGDDVYDYISSDLMYDIYNDLDLAMRKAIEQILFEASDHEDIDDMDIEHELENGGDEEITDAFNDGVRSGNESGAQKEMSDSLDSWGKGGDFTVEFNEHHKLIMSVPMSNLMDFIIGQGEDDIEDEFESYAYEGWKDIIELKDIDQPHYGWSGWDAEYAMERTEEDLPEHVHQKRDEIYKQLLRKNKGFDKEGRFIESVRYVKKR